MAVVELDPEHRAGKRLDHLAFDLDLLFLDSHFARESDLSGELTASARLLMNVRHTGLTAPRRRHRSKLSLVNPRASWYSDPRREDARAVRGIATVCSKWADYASRPRS